MTGLPVCEEKRASSPHFTGQNLCLVSETRAFVRHDAYFVFTTGLCVAETGTEEPLSGSSKLGLLRPEVCWLLHVTGQARQ